MMAQKENYEYEIDAQRLMPKIEEGYERFGVNVKVQGYVIRNERIIFQLKIKKNSRMKQLRAYAEDVQRRLKLPLFVLFEKNLEVLLAVSEQKIEEPHLSIFLKNRANSNFAQMELPCAIGYTPTGQMATVDMAKAPHSLLGGSTNSGKTTGLQALITSITFFKSPWQTRLVLIDVGASGLMPFNGLPHLACPVITERTIACQVLSAVVDELERRKFETIKY